MMPGGDEEGREMIREWEGRGEEEKGNPDIRKQLYQNPPSERLRFIRITYILQGTHPVLLYLMSECPWICYLA